MALLHPLKSVAIHVGKSVKQHCRCRSLPPACSLFLRSALGCVVGSYGSAGLGWERGEDLSYLNVVGENPKFTYVIFWIICTKAKEGGIGVAEGSTEKILDQYTAVVRNVYRMLETIWNKRWTKKEWQFPLDTVVLPGAWSLQFSFVTEVR